MPCMVIVEDNAINTRLMKEILETRYPDHSIFTAREVWDGLRMIYRHNPALVITGIRFPDTSGLKLIQWLRENKAYRELPIFVVSTALRTEADFARAFAAGATAAMSRREFSFVKFVTMVERLLLPSR
jgi:two-component system, chemotaxis family, sensor kinase CheA